ncbi:hypothetical protein HBI56_042340 [Parastagonospora nodorum]|uniref:Uncharacterized protein n=1 Tax=Phaeosphaeria nodorum (strain SN15 / ATCC MYA-4574 / FGSC 10173) TaxID=321614 RepID=A0A7U2HWF4_PHANO|nr:hypothetical protein HBH56_240760 [Parastagonospora nodorum]QRC93178.1 hypothetical protein JI435_429060 [Parastagonospora nodorum SN15]KAH3932254.1 hypothetical protein HBH54_083680 [Parastagonospora nodorum]KAH3954971.1 hypothetical protein HBH53_010690 [Parastagonospora nodorum]KAH3986598.1 hypothetical protein HBH52_041890 [Parastagonospora nodorum]
MSKKIRSVANKISMKAAYRADRLIKSVFRAKSREVEHAPAVTSSSVYSQSSGFSTEVMDTNNCEDVAPNLQTQQDDLWEKEQEERGQDLAIRQLLHASGMSAKTSRLHRRILNCTNSGNNIVHITTPLSIKAKPQKATEHTVSDTSDGTQPPAMCEQQTGIIREQDVKPVPDVDQGNDSGSDSSSLRRRGAVRLKTNPMHVCPTHEIKHYTRPR